MRKIDKLDYKLLYELDKNSRIPLSKLAKKIGLSKQATSKRISNLTKEEIIKNFPIIINPATLGYQHYKLLIRLQNISNKKEKELIDFLVKYPNSFWVAEIRGNYDYIISVLEKNIHKFKEFYQELKNKFGIYIYEENFATLTSAKIYNRSYFYPEKEKTILPYGGEINKIKIDDLDKKILSEMGLNARQSFVELGNKLNINSDTIRYRLIKMKKTNLITGARIGINPNKLNRTYINCLLNLQNFNENTIKEFENYALNFHPIIYVNNFIGSHNIEIEMETKNEEETDQIIKSFRDKFFENIKNYTILTVKKEHKLKFVPF
jgi:DNA-binding Lrp family transcriptional regulator